MAGALHIHLGRLVLSSLPDACHLSNRSEALVQQAASERGERVWWCARGASAAAAECRSIRGVCQERLIGV